MALGMDIVDSFEGFEVGGEAFDLPWSSFQQYYWERQYPLADRGTGGL